MPNKLVSVIIPSYNSASFIKAAIDSVLTQTYKNYEIIVIDDGSTDDTRIVLKPYLEKKLIKYIYQNNKGVSGARNTGIKIAIGKYIKFLDADDILLPECLQKQVNFLEKNKNFGIVYSDFCYFNKKKQFFRLGHHLTNAEKIHPVGNILSHLLMGNFIATDTLLFRKSVIDNVGLFNESLSHLEDWEYLLRTAIARFRFGYVKEVLVLCLLRQNSLSRNTLAMAHCKYQVVKNMESNFLNINIRRALKLAQYSYSIALLQNNKIKEGRVILKEIISNINTPIQKKITGFIYLIFSSFYLTNWLFYRIVNFFNKKQKFIKINGKHLAKSLYNYS